MSGQLNTRIIDGDGHILEDNPGILEHMEQPYRDIAAKKGIIFPPIDHLHDGRAVETPPLRDGREKVGPDGWLQFLEDVGIDWTVMYPTQGLGYGKIVSLDYAVAACKAYNDWAYHTYLQRDPRFNAMGLIPMQDTEEAVKELRRIVTEQGMMGAMMPSNGLPLPLGAKVYWPIYEEADRLGCCLAVHGGCHDRFGLDHMNMYTPVHALGHPWGITLNCANILYNGIFERFPNVRIAFLEGGVAWLLMLLERLHASHENALPVRSRRRVQHRRGGRSGQDRQAAHRGRPLLPGHRDRGTDAAFRHQDRRASAVPVLLGLPPRGHHQ